jgi:hypothetical protein
MIGLSLLSSSVNIICGHNDNPIIIRPHIVLTDGRQQRQPNHNTTTYCVYWRISKHNMWSYYDWVVVAVVRQLTQYVVVLWLGCRCCRPSVSAICGHVMIGLSLLSSVSKHNMCDHILCLLTDDNNDNPILIRPHIVFTDERQKRQPNHNTTTYCVYWRRQQRQPNHNMTTYCVYWRMTMTTSKHNMRSYYDWVVIVVRQ